MDDVDGRIAAIQRDREHGATFLAMEALRVLGDAAKGCEPGTDWSDCLTGVARRLAAAKPAMAAVRNATDRLLGRLLALGPDQARCQSQKLVERLLDELQAAAEAAAVNAAQLVPPSATVVTCSYSSAVVRTVRRARDAGKALNVMVLEDGTAANSPGHRLAKELEGMGLTARVFGVDASEDIIAQADLAIVGADAVTPSFAVNGEPTLALARAASGRIPLYLVCESIKLISDIGHEPGYDRVPLDLVKGIVTEEGVMSPADVGSRVRSAPQDSA